ncbi:MAG: formate transporter FocA [Gemmatimonadota bacterium]
MTQPPPPPPTVQLDALLPAEMATRAEEIGARKAAMDFTSMFVLAVLAGAFIALGAVFATSVSAGAGGVLPYGLVRLLAGLVFSLGLILVIVGGAELFTGNNLIVMAWGHGKVTTVQLVRNWGIVYLGNFVGAMGTVALVFASGHHTMGDGAVGMAALGTAALKVRFTFFEAVALGILCNALVCLAVWLTLSARTTTDKILAIVFPITAFVAAGFEHSIANMYFVPAGLLVKAGASTEFWLAAGTSAAAFGELTWSAFLWRNLLPVTIGNIIGGSLLVGAVYRVVYLRGAAPRPVRPGASAPPAGARGGAS